MDFRDMCHAVTAQITPRPWDYTAPGGGLTLTIVPAGLRADPGCAEVIVRISALGQFFDAEAGIPSRDLPDMIDALTGNRPWSHDTLDGFIADLTLCTRGGMWLTLSEDPAAREVLEEQPSIHVPEALRLPLVSALRRAADVARDWEG